VDKWQVVLGDANAVWQPLGDAILTSPPKTVCLSCGSMEVGQRRRERWAGPRTPDRRDRSSAVGAAAPRGSTSSAVPRRIGSASAAAGGSLPES